MYSYPTSTSVLIPPPPPPPTPTQPPPGCLPSLATIPIFIGLYRSLTNAANEGLFDTQGFYWIPSLAGPVTMAANKAGSGTAWLYPLVDGQPPIGWHDASLYCVLPVLLVLCQYVSSAVISPPIDPTAENANQQRVIYALLPLMIGWFALNVPSGLGLYYLSNTALTTLVQVWLRKLGGANVKVRAAAAAGAGWVGGVRGKGGGELRGVGSSSSRAPVLCEYASCRHQCQQCQDTQCAGGLCQARAPHVLAVGSLRAPACLLAMSQQTWSVCSWVRACG